MKNLSCVILAIAILLSFTTPAFCNQDNYISGLIGATLPPDSDLSSSDLSGVDVSASYELGVFAGVAVGHDFGKYRFEGEIGYQFNELDDLNLSISAFGTSGGGNIDGDVNLLTVMVNGYYDFIDSGRVIPFLTAGVGLASAEYSIGNVSGQDAVAVYQLGTGLSISIGDVTTIDIKYRYIMTNDIELDTLNVDYSSHNIIFGFTKSF